ncbi:hypothetical protein CKO11_12325 [Rhodobacter sp. TJ_12]|uniref:DUF6950 family protein n=1 Tax=Rhodobacter sp. TJ_12 TaxID=2029399 RepID=UPI001CBDD676|nr:hypothetical protein [Rhodobacter sp. TJ_12]MBZ4023244.1 hypothetical protein [Rhodobacter sp. TJ_12]
MTPLYAEVNRWLATPHQWGVADCITLPADWVARMTGADPAEDIRHTYATAGEAQRAWRFFTDPLASVAPRMARCGLRRTTAPVAGDVGLIFVMEQGGPRPHGALFLGDKWAVKTQDHGVLGITRPKVIAAWETGYCES